jgi:hypothetical protein
VRTFYFGEHFTFANILLNITDRSQTQTVCKKISQTRAYIALLFRFPFPAQARRALESGPEASKTNPAINNDRMIVPRGANHGIGTFESTATKAQSLSNGAYFSVRLRFIFNYFKMVSVFHGLASLSFLDLSRDFC